jgi:hypothetical protein
MTERRESQREAERRYRATHREELNARLKIQREQNREKTNARRRLEYVARKQYFRDYYLEHHVARWHNPCPDCSQPKSIKAKRCKACAVLARSVGRPVGVVARHPRLVGPKTTCPYCDAEMRPTVWRRRDFWRCPGCGLETTTEELKRMAYEEAA